MLTKTRKFALVLFGIVLTLGLFSSQALAATRKCYTITSGNTTVYSNTGLTTRYGTIYGSDELRVITVTGRYTQVTYPIANGRTKTGYIPTGAILWGTTGRSYTATAQITTYKRPGGSTYGYISNRDTVVVLGANNGYIQVKYPVSGGYKYAFIPSSQGSKLSGYSSGSTGTTYYVTTKAGLILRASSSTSSSKLATMPYGSAITVYSISGGWARCSYNGRQGYCSSSYISTSKPGGGGGGGSSTLSYGLYHNSSAYISCGFDGYTTTRGRHEGIDIYCGLGKPVYNLVAGTVVRVASGYRGGNGLSTVAIYDASAGKTVVYLHMAPYNVKAGQYIPKGQQIGTQDWRGVSSSSGSHTHVEVRNGRQGYAAKSVNDYTLDNPNPTSYWNSKGYSIR